MLWQTVVLCCTVALVAAVPGHEHKSHLARLSLPQKLGYQPGLVVNATPALIVGSGSLVEISWSGLAFPNPDDWFGLWCTGNSTSPPLPLGTAPLKYNVANVSDTWAQGLGSFSFFVPNVRQDCAVFVLTGGAQYPLVVGASNVITVETPNQPTGVRLALVDDTHLRVAWKTANAASPEVRLGVTSGVYCQIVAASSETFTRDECCEAPATLNGWLDPGTLHAAVVTVVPNQKYYYQVCGDSTTCSTEASFVAPPIAGQYPLGSSSLSFLAFGDMGNAGVCGAQQHSWDYDNHGEINALNTTRRMMSELESDTPPSLVLHIGDISYAVGFQGEWDQFLEQISPIARTIPWMTAIGNHEYGYSGSWIPGSDSGGECGIPYSQYFRMPAPADTGSAASPWYTFQYGPVRFVVMSTEHDFTAGSVQLTWLTKTMEANDRQATPWLVFSGHRPMYIDSDWNGSPYSDQTMAALMRQHVEPLLLKAQVDVALWGHHHSYQRTCAVAKEVCTPGAPVHMVIGMAGYDLSHNLLPTLPPYMVVALDTDWGYTRFSLNQTHMTVEFVGDSDGTVHDSVVLEAKKIVTRPLKLALAQQ